MRTENTTRWHYRITWKNGRVGLTSSTARIWDCYAHYAAKFGRTRIATVEERKNLGPWTDSALLPTSQAEADSLARKNRIREAINEFHTRNKKQEATP